MFKVNETENSKMEEYAESIYEYLLTNDLSFDVYDYDDFAVELDNAIQNGEIIQIPELDREDAFKIAVENLNSRDYDGDESMDGDFDSAMKSAGWGTDEDYGSAEDMFESKFDEDEDMMSRCCGAKIQWRGDEEICSQCKKVLSQHDMIPADEDFMDKDDFDWDSINPDLDEDLKESTNEKKLKKYAKDIIKVFIKDNLEFVLHKEDVREALEIVETKIQWNEMPDIPESDRKEAVELAIKLYQPMHGKIVKDFWKKQDKELKRMGGGPYGDDYWRESIIKDTNYVIRMLNESLVSKKAKKLGLVHVGFGNYAEEPGGPAQYKTVNGKLKRVKGSAPKKKKAEEPKKEKPKEKEEPKKETKPKKSGITDVRRVSGEKFTYEFMKDGRKYKFTLNKMERKELKGEGSVMDIIKQRMKKKEAKQKSKLFKKGQHVGKK